MSKDKILFAIAVALFVILFLLNMRETEGSVEAVSIGKFEQKIFELTNGERSKKLLLDSCLTSAAYERAKYLETNHIWSHYSPDGTTPWQFLEDCDYRYAGENLTKGFDNPTEAHKTLMKSQTHKDNIVNTKFGRMGVGCYGDVCVEYFKN